MLSFALESSPPVKHLAIEIAILLVGFHPESPSSRTVPVQNDPV
jgi:hypothetical protein